MAATSSSSSSAQAAWRLIFLSTAVSSMTSILLGYDAGVASGAIRAMARDLGLSTLQESVFISMLNLIAAPGALFGGHASDRFGRRKSIAHACCVFILGSLVKISSFSYGQLVIGRMITGLGVGMAFVVAPVYISELAPARIRGKLVSMTDICINIGIVIGYLTAFIVDTSTEDDSLRWRLMLGISLVPPFFILACLLLTPESPRWLLAHGRDQDARSVLSLIEPDKCVVEDRLTEIVGAIALEKEDTWKSLLFSRGVDEATYRALVVGLGLGVAQQASGTEAAVYFSPTLIEESGVSSNNEGAILGANIVVGLFKLGGELVAALITDRVGRRPLFLSSSSLSTICTLLLTLAFGVSAGTLIVLSLISLFMFCFSLGMGPLTFVVASEIFPSQHRGKGVSVTVFVNRLTAGVVSLLFPLMLEGIGGSASFAIFTVLSLCTVAFYYWFIPETKQKTLEMINWQLRGLEMPGPSHNEDLNAWRHQSPTT